MNRDQHLQKQNWRLPPASQPESSAKAASGDGRVAKPLPNDEAAAGPSSPAQRQALASPDMGQTAPVRVLRGGD